MTTSKSSKGVEAAEEVHAAPVSEGRLWRTTQAPYRIGPVVEIETLTYHTANDFIETGSIFIGAVGLNCPARTPSVIVLVITASVYRECPRQGLRRTSHIELIFLRHLYNFHILSRGRVRGNGIDLVSIERSI